MWAIMRSRGIRFSALFTCLLLIGIMIINDGLASAQGVAMPNMDAKVVGDPDRGRQVFRRCVSCHSLEPSGRHHIGPNLFGVIGRAAGSTEGFAFSAAMRNAGIIWSVQSLQEFLRYPRRVVPYNRMGFPGLPSLRDRRDLIAFLLTAQ